MSFQQRSEWSPLRSPSEIAPRDAFCVSLLLVLTEGPHWESSPGNFAEGLWKECRMDGGGNLWERVEIYRLNFNPKEDSMRTRPSCCAKVNAMQSSASILELSSLGTENPSSDPC
jgi:hypothetical protein